MTSNQAIETYEAMPPLQKRLVGAYQEQRLAEDERNGTPIDGDMRFTECVELVATMQ